MHNLNKICKEYVDLIFNSYGNIDPTIIFYGSNIYNASSSDLDVCIVCNENVDEYVDDIIMKTLRFHKKNNLRVDEEIPHKNKLIYKISEIKKMLNSNPFYKNGIYNIPDIEKTSQFLSSTDMKTRLLLNILTTDHKIIGDDSMIKTFENQAWDIILDAIIGFNNLKTYDAQEILNLLYKNKYTGSEGEMYLGYKKNYIEKEEYLKNMINENLKRRNK